MRSYRYMRASRAALPFTGCSARRYHLWACPTAPAVEDACPHGTETAATIPSTAYGNAPSGGVSLPEAVPEGGDRAEEWPFRSERSKPIIPQEEIDRLVSALQSVAQSARPPVADRPLTVSLFDFRETVQLSPEHLHVLEGECQNFCRVLRRTLGPYLNAEVDVQLLSMGVATFDQFAKSLAPTPVIGVFRLSRHSPLALWEITPPLAFAIVQLMLGATELSPAPAREITVLESAILGQFFEELLSTWALTWAALEKSPPQLEFVTASFAKIDMRQVDQNVTHIVLQARVRHVEGAMNIALPISVLRPLLAATMRAEADQLADQDRGGLPLSSTVSKVAVPVAVQLPPVLVEFDVLRSLKPGDLLPLGLHKDCGLVIAVNGKPKFRAVPGLTGSFVAARITEVIE